MAASRGLMGVILAGGKGTRMFPFSDRTPKPLLPVGNRPLMVHQLELMRSIGIEEVCVLIGHKGYQIAAALGDGRAYGLKLRYVEQTQALGIAHAVGQLEGHIDRPFLLFLGDIYFEARDLREMSDTFVQQGGGAVLAVKEEPDLGAIRKNYAVLQDAAGRVTRVIEKPRDPPNRLKGVGLYLFDLAVFDAIRRTPRTAMRDEYEITHTIQIMIDDGVAVRTADSILNDVNVTTRVDLPACNLLEADRAPGRRIIGPDCTIHPGAKLERCVIGRNVQIRHPITLRDTVVFDDTVVEAECDFERFVLTPDSVLDCGYDRAGVSRAR